MDRLSGYDGRPNLANANSALFQLRAGFVGIGAFQFQGSSLTTTPPTVVGTNPPAVHAGTSTGDPVTQIQVTFSTPMNPIDANAPAIYELRKAGSHGFGNLDDVVYVLTPHYAYGMTTATITIGGLTAAGLPVGLYRFTTFSGATVSIHDLSGLRLDGTNSGTEGGNYVRIFNVVAPSADLGVTAAVDNARPIEGASVRYTITLTNAGPQAATGIQVTDLLPTGVTFVSATPSVGSYDSTTGLWTVGGLAQGGTAMLVLTVTVNTGTTANTITDTATVTHADQPDPNAANNTAGVSLTVQPAVATRLAVSGFPSPVTAGTAGTVTVMTMDNNGNVIPGYRGTAHFTSSDGQALLPADYTFTARHRG